MPLSPLLAVIAIASTQAPVIRATMDLTVDPSGGTAEVTIEYVLAAAPGADALSVAAILFDQVRLGRVRATVDGQALPVSGLDTGGKDRVVGSVALPFTGAPERTIVLNYDVMDLSSHDVIRIPVLAALHAPADALPGTFIARIDLPAGWYASDAMPSGLRESSAGGAFHRYEASLQVVPAMLAFRMTEGRPPVPVAGLMVNGAIIIFLLLAGWTGWRQFRAGG